MIQGGDPTGTGRGGSSIVGGFFKDECSPELKHSGAGILSMVRALCRQVDAQFAVVVEVAMWRSQRLRRPG